MKEKDGMITVPEGVEAIRLSQDDRMVALRRLRLPLDRHDSDLLLVGDSFEQGGRYVQLEVAKAESASWSWLDWDDLYDELAKRWRARFSADLRIRKPRSNIGGARGE